MLTRTLISTLTPLFKLSWISIWSLLERAMLTQRLIFMLMLMALHMQTARLTPMVRLTLMPTVKLKAKHTLMHTAKLTAKLTAKPTAKHTAMHMLTIRPKPRVKLKVKMHPKTS